MRTNDEKPFVVRKTKAQKRTDETNAASLARADGMVAQMALWEADPNSFWNSDPVWNSKHPDYRAVNAFIDDGYTWEEALLKIEGIEPLKPEWMAPTVFGWVAEVFSRKGSK